MGRVFGASKLFFKVPSNVEMEAPYPNFKSNFVAFLVRIVVAGVVFGSHWNFRFGALLSVPMSATICAAKPSYFGNCVEIGFVHTMMKSYNLTTYEAASMLVSVFQPGVVHGSGSIDIPGP